MIGMRTAGIQAPSVNFETTTIDRDDAGGDAADGVDDRRRRAIGLPCSRKWWTTMPAWLSVNPVNTPNAYSGISAEMLPLKTMMRMLGHDGEEDDAVREHEPVAAVGELAGQEAVAGDDRRQPREVGVGGVGGEDEDGERGELRHPEQHVLAAVDVLGHERDAGRVLLAAVRLQVRGQHRHAEEARAEDARP